MRAAPRSIFLGFALLFFAVRAPAAEFRFTPTLTLSEEYNDNLFQTRQRPQTDFATRVLPELKLNANGAGFVTDLSYGLDYRYFAKGSRSDELDHRADVKTSLGYPDGFLHLDLSDSYSRVSSNVARDLVNESLVVNQVLQNNALVTPYLSWHLPGNSTLKTGYRYRDTRYWSGSGIDKMEHDGYADWSRELTEGLVVSGGYGFARVKSDSDGLDRHELYAGLRYEWAKAGFVYGKAGYDWQSFDSGGNANDPFWDLGAGHDFGVLTAKLGSKVEYAEDPQTISTRDVTHYATLSRDFARGGVSFTASWSKYEKQRQPVRDIQRKTLLALSGRYEVSSSATLTANLSGDRLESTLGTDYAYHLTGGMGVDYVLGKNAVLSTNYTHISFRNDLGSASGSIEVNRAVVEMRFSR